MALAALRSVRAGVLASVAVTALLLRWSVEVPWWSERTDAGGFHGSEVGLADFGGSPFGWCAAVACLAFAVAALPVPRRARRVACAAGIVSTVAAAAAWAVVMGRVLARDAGAHRGWAAEIWARRDAGEAGAVVARTDAEGPSLAVIVVFLLLVLAGVSALPRRHERGVLLSAAIAGALAALATPAAAVWVTTGPQTARRDWFWTPDLAAAAGPAVAILALMVPVLAAGLALRPGGRAPRAWRVAWTVTACAYCYVAGNALIVLTSSGPPFRVDDGGIPAALPSHWGAGVPGLLVLAMFLPLVAVIRVALADRAAVRRAAAQAPRDAEPADDRYERAGQGEGG